MSGLRLAVASDFALAEKLLEALEPSALAVETLIAVEMEPFNEEQALRFRGKSVEQLAVDEVDWSQFSHILFAAPIAKIATLGEALKSGAMVLDLFGMTAQIDEVPVVVPSVNDEVLYQPRERNVIALANPQISQLALALAPLKNTVLQQIFVSSLLPASYFGDEKIRQLAGQTARLLNGINLDDDIERVAFDTLPAQTQSNDSAQPFDKQPLAIETQWRKVFPQWAEITRFHSVQVPVFYGISQMVSVESSYEIDHAELIGQWQGQPWLAFHQDSVVTAVKNGESEDETHRLQISQLSVEENRLAFWAVSDEQQFSLAHLAVQLLERVQHG